MNDILRSIHRKIQNRSSYKIAVVSLTKKKQWENSILFENSNFFLIENRIFQKINSNKTSNVFIVINFTIHLCTCS